MKNVNSVGIKSADLKDKATRKTVKKSTNAFHSTYLYIQVFVYLKAKFKDNTVQRAELWLEIDISRNQLVRQWALWSSWQGANHWLFFSCLWKPQMKILATPLFGRAEIKGTLGWPESALKGPISRMLWKGRDEWENEKQMTTPKKGQKTVTSNQ